MKLSDLTQGDKAIIQKVRGRGAFRRRIMEMGFVAGKTVEVVKYAPLQDPVQYNIMGYEVSLRRDEAELIEVVSLGEGSRVSGGDYFGTQQESTLNYARPSSRIKHIKVAFVGNPNCGKTTIFNAVTGMREKVGNYGGVTVDAKTSKYVRGDYIFEITDLPGTYSLTAYSPEELFVRRHILEEMPDVVVNVLDGSNLERNLYLTTQLIDMDIKVVAALNMYDELEKRGDAFDHKTMGELLGIPFVKTVGKKGIGINNLFDEIIEVFHDRNPLVRHIHINYGKVIEEQISRIQRELKTEANYHLINKISSRYLALKLLEEDRHAIELVKSLYNQDEVLKATYKGIKNIEAFYHESVETAITDAKYGFINGALKETYIANKEPDKRMITKAIDDIITNRLYSFPLFIFIMWVMFQATFFVGQYPQEWLTYIVDWIGGLISSLMPAGMARDLLVDGVIGGVGGVIVFLPNILILFLFISLMEDTGYMARVAFIVDKIMHRVGLHGRSFVPLLMGFGCNVPAIMATRTIEGKNDRLITILITPFMSCSARLPVYVLIISAFFPKHPGSMLFLIYSIGILMAGIMAWVFRKTLLKAKELPFVMELPPYRFPTAKNILKHMWFKAAMYLKKMSGIIMIASILIWALNYFPRNINYSRDYTTLKARTAQHYDHRIKLAEQSSLKDSLLHQKTRALHKLQLEQESERSAQSLIGRLGRSLQPVMAPLGFDWRMSVSLLTGMAAKEIVISTMGVLYQSDTDNEGTANLKTKLQNARYKEGPRRGRKVYNKASAFAFLIFILFYFPCVAVIAAVRREAGGWKWALFMAVYTTALAWVFAFLSYQIGSLLI